MLGRGIGSLNKPPNVLLTALVDLEAKYDGKSRAGKVSLGDVEEIFQNGNSVWTLRHTT
jgi:hypothetical protein